MYNLMTRQNISNYLPLAFHNPSTSDARLFFTEIVQQKKRNFKFDFVVKTDEKYASITNG